MSLERPIRVFTEIKNSYNNLIKKTAHKDKLSLSDSDHLLESDGEIKMSVNVDDRQISVTGVGELILPPDKYSITIRCKSSKNDLQEAKESVKKRVDYTLQTLKNNSVKDGDMMVYQQTNFLDSKVVIDCEIEAHFSNLSICQSVSNLLAEKLGPAVTISMPRCYHGKGSLDTLRKQAGMLAIHNARLKAKEMAKVVNLSVGRAVKVEEIATTETTGGDEKNDGDFDLNPGIQQRVSDATVSISNRVNVWFLLKPSKKKM